MVIERWADLGWCCVLCGGCMIGWRVIVVVVWATGDEKQNSPPRSMNRMSIAAQSCSTLITYGTRSSA